MSGRLARTKLSLLLLGSVGCADSASDAYAMALMGTDGYAASLIHCDRINSAELQDDCRVALMEVWARLEPSDCEIVESTVWRDECIFLLGERQWQNGDLDGGLRTCEQSRFRRNCAWHLIQDEVQASLEMTAVEAEQRISGFVNARAVPDAGMQFWTIRFREQAGLGRVLDASDCEQLSEPIACRAAVERHVLTILDSQSTRDLPSVCAAEVGQRATLNGQPAWLMDAVTQQAEALWVRTRCSDAVAGPED